MNATTDSAPCKADFPSGKVIYCILPDDGTDKRILTELRKKKGVVRAGSATRRGIGALITVKTKRGRLPEPELVKQVHVICSEEEADGVFEFLFWSAEVDKPGRGFIWQQSALGCIPYELPSDEPDEETGA